MPVVCQSATVSADEVGAQALRADRVVQQLTGRSRGEVRGLFDHACVVVNGQPCDVPGRPLAAGDLVEVRYDNARKYHEVRRPPAPAGGPLYRLVHEDDELIVIDKGAPVLTVPARGGDRRTVVHALESHLTRSGRRRRVEVVHRLDRDVSGLLVFAKDDRTARRLQQQFAAHSPLREYVAIVAGMVLEPVGRFESFLTTGKDLTRYSTRDEDEGERAVTHYRTIEAVRGATLVRVRLETGQRNQIRVHFAEAGHPVLGDPRYHADKARHPDWTARRLALHAETLGFIHPTTKKELLFTSAPPAEFQRFVGHKLRV